MSSIDSSNYITQNHLVDTIGSAGVSAACTFTSYIFYKVSQSEADHASSSGNTAVQAGQNAANNLGKKISSFDTWVSENFVKDTLVRHRNKRLALGGTYLFGAGALIALLAAGYSFISYLSSKN